MIEDVIVDQREQILRANSRIDRLMEAVARKELVPLVMPAETYPANREGYVKRSILPAEQSPGWFDTRKVPVTPTPSTLGGNRSET